MTTKQMVFAKNYVSNGFNAAKAARDAGYSEHTAKSQGQRLLTKADVKTYISKIIKDQLSDTDRATMEIINTLDKIIKADIGEYVEVRNGRIFVSDTADLDTSTLSEISSTQTGIKVKMHDKLKAIELKGKFLSLWNDGQLLIKEESKKETLSKEERRERILKLSKKLHGSD